MDNRKFTLADARTLVARSRDIIVETKAVIQQSRQTLSETDELVDRSLSGEANLTAEQPRSAQSKTHKRPKRNKLFYKNRWLISRHVVMALRRAGVVCDIIVPDEEGEDAVPGSRTLQ